MKYNIITSMSPSKKKITKEERAGKIVKALDTFTKTKEFCKSMKSEGLSKDLAQASRNLPKDVSFEDAAAKYGFSPEAIMRQARELYDQPVTKYDKNGNLVEYDDPTLKLKVLQFVSVIAHQSRDNMKKTEHKHLHLHNKTNAELDKLLKLGD